MESLDFSEKNQQSERWNSFLHFICVVYFIKHMLHSPITSEEPVPLGIHSEVGARVNQINECEH